MNKNQMKKPGHGPLPLIHEMIKTFMKYYSDIMSTIELNISESQFFTTSVFTIMQRTGLKYYDEKKKN